MVYQVREGIVKLRICGVSFLTPTRKESENCSPIMPLNLFNSIIWQMLSDHKTIDDVYSTFEKMFSMSKNSQTEGHSYKEVVDKYLKDFIDKGYVIETED